MLTVTATAVRGPFYETTAEGRSVIRCEVDLRAAASGAGKARWLDATFLYYFGKERTTPTDSAVLPAAEIVDSWGGPALMASGEVRESGWEIGAYAPFELAIEYHYSGESGGKPKTARVEFQCGPQVPADAPPPAVSSLTVAPTADVEPGDTIVVTYTATSTMGLWQTAVVLEGACEAYKLFDERLATTATHTVALIVPANCQLGEELDLNVYAWDAALQATARGIAFEGAVSDHTPPVIQPMFFPPRDGGSATFPPITGDLFAGDSLELILNASDNNALRAIVWEVLPSGFKDSVIVSGPFASPWIWIPFRAEWGRDVQLRLYARDAQGLTSAVVESPPGAITVYPTSERPVRKATVSGEIRSFVVDEKRDVVYLIQSNERRVAVFSLATMSVATTLELPFYPTDADLSVSGDSLVLTSPLDVALAVVDLRAATLQATLLPLTALDATIQQRPSGVRVLSNGHAFVSLEGSTSAAYRVLDVDLASGAQRMRTEASGGLPIAGGIERSGDRSMLVLDGVGDACLQRYDVATDRFGPCRPGAFSRAASVDATGRNSAIALDVYDESLTLTRRVNSVFRGGVPTTAISPDGEVLFQVHWQLGIIRSRVGDGVMLDRIPNSIQPTAMRATPDGGRLITVDSQNGATSRVSVIELR